MTIIYLTRHRIPDKTKYKKSLNELEQNKFDFLETFKLTFKEKELINIESVGNINENI